MNLLSAAISSLNVNTRAHGMNREWEVGRRSRYDAIETNVSNPAQSLNVEDTSPVTIVTIPVRHADSHYIFMGNLMWSELELKLNGFF